MQVVFERRDSAAARWSWRLAVFAATLFALAALAHRFRLLESVPFIAVLGLVGLLAVLALLLSLIGFARLWQRGHKGGMASTRAAFVALILLLPFGWTGFEMLTESMLHDVASDPLDPPQLTDAALRGPYMNPVRPITAQQAAIQAQAYPQVTGRRFALPMDRALEMVEATLAQLRWPMRNRPVAEDGMAEVTVAAEAPSLVLGFVSDVSIRIANEGDTTYVDMRSASRYGRHDAGDNARKIERFFAALDAEFAARTAPAAAAD